MPTIACPSCAQSVDETVSYCPNCGNPISTSAERTSDLRYREDDAAAPAARRTPRAQRPPRAPSPLERFVTDVELRPALLSAVAAGGYFLTNNVVGGAGYGGQALGLALSIVFGLLAAAGCGLGATAYARQRDGFMAGFALLGLVALIANIGLLIFFTRVGGPVL